jgi:hypothetical protein
VPHLRTPGAVHGDDSRFVPHLAVLCNLLPWVPVLASTVRPVVFAGHCRGHGDGGRPGQGLLTHGCREVVRDLRFDPCSGILLSHFSSFPQ